MILYSWFTEHSRLTAHKQTPQDLVQQNPLIWPIAKVRKTVKIQHKTSSLKDNPIDKQTLNKNGFTT